MAVFWRAAPVFAVVASVALFGSVAAPAAMEEAELRPIRLSEVHRNVRYIGPDRIALWGPEAASVTVVTADAPETITSYAPSTKAQIVDIASDPETGALYVLGRNGDAPAPGVLTKFDADGAEAYTIAFTEPLSRPTLHLSRREGEVTLLLNDASSSIVAILPDPDASAGASLSRADLKAHNVFLEAGPASEVAVDSAGAFLAGYHPASGAVSVNGLVAPRTSTARTLGERVDEGALTPKLMAIPPSRIFGMNERSGLLVLDMARQFVFLLAFDEATRRSVDILAQGFAASSSWGKLANPEALLGASDNLSAIAIGVEGADQLLLVSVEDNAFLGPYRPFGTPAVVSLDVAPDGRSMAMLVSDGTEFMVVKDPVDWAKSQDRTLRSPEVENVQRMLAAIGLNPGFVDGLSGPQTWEAISRFRTQTGLPSGRSIDERLTETMSSVVTQRSPDHPCTPLPAEERCAADSPTMWGTRDPSLPRICRSGRDPDLPLQIDYVAQGEGSEPAYQCSAMHNCAFLGIFDPSNVATLCGDS